MEISRTGNWPFSRGRRFLFRLRYRRQAHGEQSGRLAGRCSVFPRTNEIRTNDIYKPNWREWRAAQHAVDKLILKWQHEGTRGSGRRGWVYEHADTEDAEVVETGQRTRLETRAKKVHGTEALLLPFPRLPWHAAFDNYSNYLRIHLESSRITINPPFDPLYHGPLRGEGKPLPFAPFHRSSSFERSSRTSRSCSTGVRGSGNFDNLSGRCY